MIMDFQDKIIKNMKTENFEKYSPEELVERIPKISVEYILTIEYIKQCYSISYKNHDKIVELPNGKLMYSVSPFLKDALINFLILLNNYGF